MSLSELRACVRAVGAANSSTAKPLVQCAVTIMKERRMTKRCCLGRKRVEVKKRTMDRSSADTRVHHSPILHPSTFPKSCFLPTSNDLLLPGLAPSSIWECCAWADQFVHFYKRSQAGRLADTQSPCFFTAGCKGNWRRVLLHAESPCITSARAGKIMNALMQKSMQRHICCTTVHILISICICLFCLSMFSHVGLQQNQ